MFLHGKRYSIGLKSFRTHENVERVREALLLSPERSARRHFANVCMSDRRILHLELNVHTFKMQLLMQFLVPHWKN